MDEAERNLARKAVLASTKAEVQKKVRTLVYALPHEQACYDHVAWRCPRDRCCPRSYRNTGCRNVAIPQANARKQKMMELEAQRKLAVPPSEVLRGTSVARTTTVHDGLFHLC
jgi:hypothetical protein